MACYRPIPTYQRDEGGPVKLWANIGEGNLAIPCSKCIGCKTDKALEWANRCAHEMKQYQENIFLTLTYDDEHLPKDGHLEPEEFTKFIKRLRRNAEYSPTHITNSQHNIKYFGCGEYGEKNERPHYHVLAFNTDFRDKIKVGSNRGRPLYESEELKRLWPYGGHRYGPATPASANYIAQYTLKKIGSGDYDKDGVWRPAPFLRMSRNLGVTWLDKYATDIQHGYLIQSGGGKTQIPRTYIRKLTEKAKAGDRQAAHILENIDTNRGKYTRGDANHRLTAAEAIHLRRKQLTENRNL